jgi:sugar lactone lactonase YvrE
VGGPAIGHRHDTVPGPVMPVAVVPRPVSTDFSEGIAVSKHGDIYFGLALSGGIYRRAPDGALSLLAQLPTGGGVLLGLALDHRDVLHAALASFDDATSGVWRVGPDGATQRILAMPGDALPNALAFDEDGDLYVTDSAGGAIWRLGRNGAGSIWAVSDLLRGFPGGHGFPSGVGANGIAHRQRAFYTVNTDTGRIVRVGISREGSAEPPTIWFDGSGLLVTGDGVAFDVKGNLYVGDQDANQLVRIAPDGKLTVLVTAAQSPLFLAPTNPAFGRREGDERTIYVTAPSAFFFEGGMDVVSVRNDVPGMPLP